LSDVENGIKELGNAITSVAADMDACKIAITDAEKLDNMAKNFKNPLEFAWHAGKDLLINGKDIYADITDGMTAYDSGNYQTFGNDVGKALSSIFVGNEPEVFLQ